MPVYLNYSRANQRVTVSDTPKTGVEVVDLADFSIDAYVGVIDLSTQVDSVEAAISVATAACYGSPAPEWDWLLEQLPRPNIKPQCVSQIVFDVPKHKKAAYLAAAKGKKLGVWIESILDAAASKYLEKSGSENDNAN